MIQYSAAQALGAPLQSCSSPECLPTRRPLPQPRSEAVWCNFTLGDTLLATRRLEPLEWQGGLPNAAALPPPAQMIDADRWV